MRRFLFFVCCFFVLVSCKEKKSHIVILTNRREIAPYVELFNKENAEKAVLIYEKKLEGAACEKGDLLIGEYLERREMNKNYKSLDSLFDRAILREKDFYAPLLDAARENSRLFMLPVSFNLPLIMFSRENSAYIKEEYSLTIDELRKFAAAYDKIDSKGRGERLGFCPLSKAEFLYAAIKSGGVDFSLSNGNFVYNEEKLASSVRQLREWRNGKPPSLESDFIYRYLAVNDAKQALSGRVLAVFTTSDKYFSLDEEELSNLDFRYLKVQAKIHAEEGCIMLAVAKKSRKKKVAEKFIAWFFNEKTQKELLLRHFQMKLDERDFGIAGGLSSLKKVNEDIMPSFYPDLLQNELNEKDFDAKIPAVTDWKTIKSKVILPFLTESVLDESDTKLLCERYREFIRMYTK